MRKRWTVWLLCAAMLSTAAGVVIQLQNSVNMAGSGDEFSALASYNQIVTDIITNESESYLGLERYEDGVYTYSSQGEEEQMSMTPDRFRSYQKSDLAVIMPDVDELDEVTVTDADGFWMVEFTGTEEYGRRLEQNICEHVFQNPKFLDDMATSFAVSVLTGYVSVDRNTGLPVTFSMSLDCVHDIEGEFYSTAQEYSCTIQMPSLDAYENIHGQPAPEAEPQEKATPVFYKVTDDEDNTMWLLGTIHVGDSRTAFLPQEIYDAFAESDALAVEFDDGAFEEALEADAELGAAISEAYIYTDGTTIADHLDQEIYAAAVQAMFEMWCRGDEAELIAYLRDETEEEALTEEERALMEEYNDVMLTVRNAHMLEVAESYLASGDTVFYAVGLAHLLGPDGLVDALRGLGYTVELVTYG